MTDLTVHEISLTRFNALGGYARVPGSWIMIKELGYYEVEGGDVIGIATMDTTDKDFSGIVLARDKKLRFRAVNLVEFKTSPEAARESLFQAMQQAALSNIEEHYQGDEKGKPIDFFTHLHDEGHLNPAFVQLTTNEGYSPARSIIEPMMRWYQDADGNFVEQFQTTGFDQRIWELYLFATLIEAGYILNRDHNVPDFCCDGVFGPLYVEAVTLGPTYKEGKVVDPPSFDTEEQMMLLLKNYMPIKFGSPLYTKLKKKYWEKPHVQDGPFVLAIADFSSPMSMVRSQSALQRYLFGYVNRTGFTGDRLV